MSLSKREKVLLYLLAIVLLIAAFFFIFQQNMKKIELLDADLLSVQGESMKIRSAISNLDSVKSELPQLKSTAMSIKDSLYTVMKNKQVDSLITKLGVSCDLHPVSLSMENARLLPITSYSVFGTSAETAEGAGFETQNVYTSNVVFTATGSKMGFYYFINAINNREGLRLTSFSFISTPKADTYDMTFSISAFMTNITEETFNVGEETA